jgi:2-dehydropantoate 2-reductase
MSAPKVRVAVIGMGAIGSIFAAWLAALEERVELKVLARGATLQALRTHGLRITAESNEQTIPVDASDDPASFGVQDLVVVAVKGPALASVAPTVRDMLGPETTVILAMNGVPHWFFYGQGGPFEGRTITSVDPGGHIEASIPSDRVLGCVVHVSAATGDDPGRVRHVAGRGLILGEPSGTRTPRLMVIARLLEEAGFAITLSDRIQTDVWFKLWGNMTMNPISALTSATTDRILDDPLARSFVSAVMLEAKAIGERIGCPISQSPEDRHAVTRKLGPFKTSMLQDAERGRPMEVDVLLTAVHEIGALVGLRTPNLDALLALTRLMAASRRALP